MENTEKADNSIEQDTENVIELQESKDEGQNSEEQIEKKITPNKNVTELIFGELLAGIKEVGMFYTITLILVILGILMLVSDKYNNPNLVLGILVFAVLFSGWLNKKNK